MRFRLSNIIFQPDLEIIVLFMVCFVASIPTLRYQGDLIGRIETNEPEAEPDWVNSSGK